MTARGISHLFADWWTSTSSISDWFSNRLLSFSNKNSFFMSDVHGGSPFASNNNWGRERLKDKADIKTKLSAHVDRYPTYSRASCINIGSMQPIICLTDTSLWQHLLLSKWCLFFMWTEILLCLLFEGTFLTIFMAQHDPNRVTPNSRPIVISVFWDCRD